MKAEPDLESFDAAIIGGGPAGLSAAIVLGRSCRRVIVFDHGKPRNYAAQAVHCFLGSDGISPDNLRDQGRQEAIYYGAEINDSEVKSVQCLNEDGDESIRFLTVSESCTVKSRAVLFATGVMDHLPRIAGIDELYGRSVHHCPYCDGWEHRGKHLVALADGRGAVKLALSLQVWSKQVTSCSNGHSFSPPERKLLTRNGIAYREERVERMAEQDETRVEISFYGSAPLTCDAVFFGGDQGQRSSLPQTLGCVINHEGLIERDAKQRTGVEGIFVAGDAAGDVQFAIAAAAEGATAAIAINHMLQEQEILRREFDPRRLANEKNS